MNNESDETPIWRGTPSQWTHFGTYFMCLALAAVVAAAYFLVVPREPLILLGLILPAVWALGRWIATRCVRYEVTSERVKIITGLFSRHTSELELYRVRDYAVVEPFFLRLLGRGDVVLVTSDRMTPQVVLRAVPHAHALKDEIRTSTEKMRQRRGVRDMEIDSPSSTPLPPAE